MIRGLVYLTGLVTLGIIGLIAAVAFRVDEWPWRDYADDGREYVVDKLGNADLDRVFGPESGDPKNQGSGSGNSGARTDPAPVKPAPEPVVEKPAPPPPAWRHKISKGDTLYHIARQYYGDAEKWRIIAAANNILVPADLHVGRVLTIPAPQPGKQQSLMQREPRFAVAPSLAFEVCLGEAEPEESRP